MVWGKLFVKPLSHFGTWRREVEESFHSTSSLFFKLNYWKCCNILLTKEMTHLGGITGYSYYVSKWNQKIRNKDELHFPHHELMKCVLVYEKKKMPWLPEALCFKTII